MSSKYAMTVVLTTWLFISCAINGQEMVVSHHQNQWQAWFHDQMRRYQKSCYNGSPRQSSSDLVGDVLNRR